eukprot:TRINITY_DN73815_c0_g1_i1.p1 TRINITY_DN73815_c0_g1~~TRINITY_DN73815_c0_g1_i1.p1  ORF type:complete len:1023 (+),score=159.29 TRINITY_DN73815_c0_g1_i1:90-3071(+)
MVLEAHKASDACFFATFRPSGTHKCRKDTFPVENQARCHLRRITFTDEDGESPLADVLESDSCQSGGGGNISGYDSGDHQSTALSSGSDAECKESSCHHVDDFERIVTAHRFATSSSSDGGDKSKPSQGAASLLTSLSKFLFWKAATSQAGRLTSLVPGVGKSDSQSNQFAETFLIELLELALAVCDASAEECLQLAKLALQNRSKNYRALQRLTALVRLAGFGKSSQKSVTEGRSRRVIPQLPVPLRDLATLFLKNGREKAVGMKDDSPVQVNGNAGQFDLGFASEGGNSAAPDPMKGKPAGASSDCSSEGTHAARRGFADRKRSTSRLSDFSFTSFTDFNNHQVQASPSFLEFLTAIREPTETLPEEPLHLDDMNHAPVPWYGTSFSSAVDVGSETGMSYHSGSLIGKPKVLEILTNNEQVGGFGHALVRTSCLKTQAVWQRQLISQQRSLLGLVSSKLQEAEEVRRAETSVREDEKDILRNFRKIITRELDPEMVAPGKVSVLVVDSSPAIRAEVQQLCQLLEYPCSTHTSLTMAEMEVQKALASSVSAGPTQLVLLGHAWLDRELPEQFQQDAVHVTLTSQADDFEEVGRRFSASSDTQIRAELRERGILQYLLHPLSLEDLRSTASRAQQRRFAEEYLVCDTLGRGTSGVVHRVKRVRDGRLFAVKEIPTRQLRGKARASLQQEVELLRTLVWPSIVPFHDAWENRSQQLQYIVMPYVEGGTVKTRIAAARENQQEEHIPRTASTSSFVSCNTTTSSSFHQPIRRHTAEGWFAECLHAVTYLHWRGIIHRDIKPDNLLLRAGGTLQMCDFGSAASLPEPGPHPRKDECLAMNLATPFYAAPESARRQLLPASDMWSVGACFFEVFTLRTLMPEALAASPASILEWLTVVTEHGSGANCALQVSLEELRDTEMEEARTSNMDISELLALSPAQRPCAAELASRSHNMNRINAAFGSKPDHQADFSHFLKILDESVLAYNSVSHKASVSI